MVPEDVWRAEKAAHEQRVDAWTAGHLARRSRGQTHPVEDFLFTYYPHRPAHLRRWSPGLGVQLDAGPALPDVPDRARRTAVATVDLLELMAGRRPHLGCFGLHEWAMVHRSEQHGVRHPGHPLRLGAAGTDAVVESLPVRCSHFDAFRFFTPSAVPLNQLQPTAGGRPQLEQPGCLHATMDLYKHAFRLSPWVPSLLVADCFELARRVRVLDMRASPYDFSVLGLEPVRIETPAGRAEYAVAQAAFAAAAVPLRARLLDAARRVISTVSSSGPSSGPSSGTSSRDQDGGPGQVADRAQSLGAPR